MCFPSLTFQRTDLEKVITDSFTIFIISFQAPLLKFSFLTNKLSVFSPNINALFFAQRLPTPNPPTSFEFKTQSHVTTDILFPSPFPLPSYPSIFGTLTGARDVEKKCKGNDPKTDFKRVSLPPIDRFLFQEDSRAFTLSTTDDQTCVRAMTKPTSKPKYWKVFSPERKLYYLFH